MRVFPFPVLRVFANESKIIICHRASIYDYSISGMRVSILAMRCVNKTSNAVLVIIIVIFVIRYEYVNASDSSYETPAYGVPKSICNIDAIQMIQLSDLVFTGKIERLQFYKYNEDGAEKEVLAIARVKRIIKANVKYFKYVISGYEMSIKLSRQFFDHIDRIFTNSSRNCTVNYNLDNVRVNDTKIFYGKFVDAKADGNGEWLKDDALRQHVLIAVPDAPFEGEILRRISDFQSTSHLNNYKIFLLILCYRIFER